MLLLPFLAFALLWALDYWWKPDLYADAVEYAVAARELAAGRAGALIAFNRPPLFAVLIALLSKLAHLDPGTALRVVVLLSGFAAVGLTWYLLWRLTKDTTAALVAAMMTAVGIPAACGLRFALSTDALGLCMVIVAVMATAAAGGGAVPPVKRQAGSGERTGLDASGSVALALGTGVLWALAALTRTQYAPLGPAALLLFIGLNRRLPGAILWPRALALFGGWLIPLGAYYTLLSLAAQRVTMTNAYDLPYIMSEPSIGRIGYLARVVGASLFFGSPLLVLSWLLLRPPRPPLSSFGETARRILPWMALVGGTTVAVALSSWPERRYFLAAHWCVWTAAGLACAARRAAARQDGLSLALPPRLQVAALVCLTLAAATFPVYAWRRHDTWLDPSPAYASAARWVNATFGPKARIAVTGGKAMILYHLSSFDVHNCNSGLYGDWATLETWLRQEQPDVVVIGPDPGRRRGRRVRPVYDALLRRPEAGQKVGLVWVRSFPSPEGAVHVLRTTDRHRSASRSSDPPHPEGSGERRPRRGLLDEPGLAPYGH